MLGHSVSVIVLSSLSICCGHMDIFLDILTYIELETCLGGVLMPSISLFGSAITVNVIIAFAFALILVFLLARLLISPFRGAGRYVLKLGTAAAAIMLINVAAPYTGFTVPLNPVTIVASAVLGFPGLVMVAVLQFLVF